MIDDHDFLDLDDLGPDIDPGTDPFEEPDDPAGYVGGPPLDAMEHWHLQEAPDTCAVAAQEFVLDDITGVDHPEAELVAVAQANGWYTAGGGTAPDDVGKLLEHYGVPVERRSNASVDDLAAALAAGEHVIVGVDSGELAFPGGYDPQDPLDHYPGIPGQRTDHAVQVIGIDATDPAGPVVVLNDPGRPDGQGSGVPLAAFVEAWADSGNLMVTARAA